MDNNETNKPVLSVITVTYNSEKYISSALSSVASQADVNYEHLVIDNQSSDSTLNIVKNFDNPRVRLISEPDNGIYDALNKGISLSKGEYIAILHSDDLLASSRVYSDLLTNITENSVDMVYTDLVYVLQSDPEKVVRYWRSNDFNRKRLRLGWMPPHPTCVMRRSIYDKIGGFDLKYKIAADYDFLVKVFNDQQISKKYCKGISYKMRIGGVSNGRLSNILIKTKEDVQIFRKNGFFIPISLFLKNWSKIKQLWKR